MTSSNADDSPASTEPERRVIVSAEEFRNHYRTLLEALRGLLGAASARGAGPAERPWALVGIKRRGAVFSQRLQRDLEGEYPELAYGELDIALYRDDNHLKGANVLVLGTEIDFDVEGASILLVDDVLYTGRTVRCAIDQLCDFGRARRIWLAAFVDRGDRELPIEANFVGCRFDVGPGDRVDVSLVEMGEEEDAVVLTAART